MKILTKTTFVIGENETVNPGEIVDIKDKNEALSLIERGLAELPDAKPVIDNEQTV